MALNTVSSDRLSTNVKTSNLGTELKKKVGQNKNLIINGAMQVAQRGTSSTSSGYATIDRFQTGSGNIGQNVTQSQQSLSSSDTGPYEAGFRKYKRAQLAAAGNANANGYVEAASYKVEAQDLATSGWDSKSSSSKITLSFWFRCSTNQAFRLNVRSEDGTARMFSTNFTATGNNTWTKITQTIPGNTSPTVDVDNDNGSGLAIFVIPFYGTDYTDSGSTMDAWKTYSGSSQGTDMASTWLTAGASTFDITGVQLEVGSVATDFEHRSIGHELALCQRYFYKIVGTDSDMAAFGFNYSASDHYFNIEFPVPMRDYPTYTGSSTDARIFAQNIGQDFQLSAMSIVGNMTSSNPNRVTLFVSQGGATAGEGGLLSIQNTEGSLSFSAEL